MDPYFVDHVIQQFARLGSANRRKRKRCKQELPWAGLNITKRRRFKGFRIIVVIVFLRNHEYY